MSMHANGLPDAKSDYVRGLIRNRQWRALLGNATVADLAIVLYHAEISYSQAWNALAQLARSRYPVPREVQYAPSSELNRLFGAAGLGSFDIQQALATLSYKRAHLGVS